VPNRKARLIIMQYKVQTEQTYVKCLTIHQNIRIEFVDMIWNDSGIFNLVM